MATVIELIANRYALMEKIGMGGMGNVYRGIDQHQQAPVAIKVLKPELATVEMVARFVREGDTLRQLNHPHIVAGREAVQENGQYYLIMELVEGGSLSDLLEKTPRLPLKRVLEIALDLADALARAHRLDIIHRDIKPANVLLAKDGSPRLTDFGIARVTDSKITETGAIFGTTAYIAPEVLRGEPADGRSDIWSFGVMLYEMLAGKRPFQAENPGNLIYTIIAEPLPDLEATDPDLPPGLIDLVYRMLMKNPSERIPSMRLVGVELESILRGEVFTATPLRLVPPTSPFDELTARFATPSPLATNTPPHNLPIQTAQFVGREAELIEVQKLLHDPAVRLVTILAPGGMGKTRLSLEIAGQFIKPVTSHTGRIRFAQGVFFVDLAPLTDPETIIPAIAETVGYLFQQDGRDQQQQLLNFLREKSILFIMDNFEHIAAGRSIISDILGVAPAVKILVTSREKLNLSSETVFALSGMEFPTWETPADALEFSAVKLFMQSARRVRPDFELAADDLSHIARICKAVYGMPLGILLAAAWLELLAPHEIADEISRSLDFLETEMHDVPERHRSLRNVFEYSWDLLPDPERQLFVELAIFRGGFTREAAQAITGASLRTLGTLVNKSLLRRDVMTGRYEVHELLRQYAAEKLNQSTQTRTVQTAHTNYYTHLIAQLTPKLKGQGQLAALDTIENDLENIRAAWMWAVAEQNIDAISRAMEGLYLFLNYRNRQQEGEQLFSQARAVWRVSDENPPLIAGQMLVRFPDTPPLSNFRLGLAIAQQHDNLSEIALCERLIGHWLSHHDFNQDEGVPLLLASLEHYEALHDDFYTAQTLDDVGWSYSLLFETQKQLVVVQRSLALRRQIDDQIGMANSLRNMGGAVGGFFDTTGQAIAYWEEAKQIAYRMNDRLGIAWNASLQAITCLLNGDIERTIHLIEESQPHARDMNDPVVSGSIKVIEGMLAALVDEDYAKAEALIMSGYPPSSPPDFRVMLASTGIIISACGSENFALAKIYFDGLMGMHKQMDKLFVPLVTPLAVVKLAQDGELIQAVELMSYFFNTPIMPEPDNIGLRLPNKWATQWKLMTDLQARLETELGTTAFQAAWERGKTMDVTAVVEDIIQRLG